MPAGNPQGRDWVLFRRQALPGHSSGSPRGAIQYAPAVQPMLLMSWPAGPARLLAGLPGVQASPLAVPAAPGPAPFKACPAVPAAPLPPPPRMMPVSITPLNVWTGMPIVPLFVLPTAPYWDHVRRGTPRYWQWAVALHVRSGCANMRPLLWFTSCTG